MPIAGSLTPLKMRGEGKERGDRPREFWEVFKGMVLRSGLCE